MCAMIPMLRVLSRENLRGLCGAWAGGVWRGCGQKERAPRARAHDRDVPWASRYVLEVSILAQRATRGGARMSGALRGTEPDDSKGPMVSRAPVPTLATLRLALCVAGLAGALALVLATFA